MWLTRCYWTKEWLTLPSLDLPHQQVSLPCQKAVSPSTYLIHFLLSVWPTLRNSLPLTIIAGVGVYFWAGWCPTRTSVRACVSQLYMPSLTSMGSGGEGSG